MQSNEAIRQVLEIHHNEIAKIYNVIKEQMVLLGSMKDTLVTIHNQTVAETEILRDLLLMFLELTVRMNIMPREMPDSLVSAVLSKMSPETRSNGVRITEILEAWGSIDHGEP